MASLPTHHQHGYITFSPGGGSTFLNSDVYYNLNSSCSRYLAVPCRTKDKDFSLNLGLLEFGAAYLFIITNVSSSWPPPLSLPHVQIDICIYICVCVCIYPGVQRICGKTRLHTYFQCKTVDSIVTLESLLRCP